MDFRCNYRGRKWLPSWLQNIQDIYTAGSLHRSIRRWCGRQRVFVFSLLFYNWAVTGRKSHNIIPCLFMFWCQYETYVHDMAKIVPLPFASRGLVAIIFKWLFKRLYYSVVLVEVLALARKLIMLPLPSRYKNTRPSLVSIKYTFSFSRSCFPFS